MALDLRAADLSDCSREPIHIPGAVQPFGCLVVLDAGGKIIQVSGNTQSWLGVPAQALLSCVADDPRQPGLQDAISAIRAAADGAASVSLGSETLCTTVHRHDGAILVEFERPPAGETAPLDLGGGLKTLTECQSGPVLLEAVADIAHRLTGFDRVLVYRFDDDGHGEVIAERINEGIESYLGLHFPESDIPSQARTLYLKNWIRCIPDARYTPVALSPALRPDTGRPLDLSHAVLRSVSAIHLEYLGNMGLRASMSISLIVDGRLWGLISCGHRTPMQMPGDLRSALESVGRLVSLQLSGFRALRFQRERELAAGPIQQLRNAMIDSPAALLRGLTSVSALAALTGASGVAVLSEGKVNTSGNCPATNDILAISEWARANSDNGLYHTRKLPELDERFAHLGTDGAGVLALDLPTGDSIMWFRPESVRMVNWGGNPDKAASTQTLSGGEKRLHPRLSFDLWRRELRNTSSPWFPSELDAARELRRHVIEVDLARQVEKEREAVQARDDLVAVVSHDLRTPVSVVAMQAALIQRLLSQDVSESSKRLLASAHVVQRAAERMTSLLNNLLDLAKIEAGRFEVSPQPHAAGGLLEEAHELVSPLAEAKTITLSIATAPELMVRADAERVFQVLSNLLGNAIKFTPEGGHIQMGARAAGEFCEFFVQDSGVGMTSDQMQHVFDRYWQGRSGERGGAGLGLYICKGIVEAHGGSISAGSNDGGGALMRFTLPLAAGAA